MNQSLIIDFLNKKAMKIKVGVNLEVRKPSRKELGQLVVGITVLILLGYILKQFIILEQYKTLKEYTDFFFF